VRPYRNPILRPLFLWYWRLRERDVLDARETTGGKSVPVYEFGKVTGLSPDLTITTETTESPYVCCGYCSAAMACRAARTGLSDLMGKTAHPIRSQGGRPHDNGSRASELRAGAKAAHGVKLDPLARDEIPGWLRDGYAVVINLDYADLPGWLKVQGGSFGHSCTLFGWREDGDLVGFFDPLWGQDARGAWAPWSSIKPALWADGEHSGTVTKIVPPPPEPAPVPPQGPAPEETYSRAELEAAARDAAVWAIVGDDDREVGEWVAWLGAPGPAASDRWDAGAWAAPEAIFDPDDPCAPGAPARWARGAIPHPVGPAIEARRVPAVWGSSGWRAALWRGV
jgi:hypothetical protein